MTDADKYHAFIATWSSTLGVPAPRYHVDEIDSEEPDLKDHVRDGEIWFFSPYWEWNAAHEFTHYLFWLARRGGLTYRQEENFIEFFVTGPRS